MAVRGPGADFARAPGHRVLQRGEPRERAELRTVAFGQHFDKNALQYTIQVFRAWLARA